MWAIELKRSLINMNTKIMGMYSKMYIAKFDQIFAENPSTIRHLIYDFKKMLDHSIKELKEELLVFNIKIPDNQKRG